MVGVRPDGTRELITVEDGYRESALPDSKGIDPRRLHHRTAARTHMAGHMLTAYRRADVLRVGISIVAIAVRGTASARSGLRRYLGCRLR